MKKTLLAAALLAGFAGAAQAETSVTLYGIIDTGLGYTKVEGPGGADASSFGMINGVQSGSRWGLRGSEDLGGGLRAVFQLESGFDSSNGNSAQGGRLFGRNATVGLASDSWGSIDFGRTTNIASKYFGAIDPFALGFGVANMGVAFSQANTHRMDQTVIYQTPSFSGFQFGVGYSFDTDARTHNFEEKENVRQFTTGLRYANGPLTVALTYDQMWDDENSSDEKAKAWAIGGAYDFEVVKLSLAYGQTRDGWFTGTNPDGLGEVNAVGLPSNTFAPNFKASSYLVGLSAPIGAATDLLFSWQMVDPNTALTQDNEKLNIFSLGATYDLSKRTNLYALVSYGKNWGFQDDVEATTVGLGIRHRF